MTIDQMRAELEAIYAAALQTKQPGVKTGQVLPAGVTAMGWNVEVKVPAERLTREDFLAQFGDFAGDELASVGLSYGCTSFARLRVQDRPTAKVGSRGGPGIPRVRPRQIIVHAIGWGHNAAKEYEHRRRWPHAIGRDVPETSKRPKGDTP